MKTMILELFKSPSFSVIVGVILGFLLAEVSRYISYRVRICKLKRMIAIELKSILAQIPLKKDIINQVINELKQNKILSGLSVAILNMGYKQHISELYKELSVLKRNCLHVIHQRLEIADKLLSSYHNELILALQQKIIKNPFQAYINTFQEVLKSYDDVEYLIKGYLNKKPTDVFYIKNMERRKTMKLSLKGFTITGGILWAFCIVAVGILNIIFPAYGGDFLKLMASVYPGYKASGKIGDVIVGTLYALLDGAIRGFIFALLYNAFVGKDSKGHKA